MAPTIWTWLTLFAATVGAFQLRTTTKDLYGPEDAGVRVLEKEGLSQVLVNSEKPWMVQFYSSWCGHCQHFKPIFADFARRVQGWTDVMGIGVINCAQEYNTQVCT